MTPERRSDSLESWSDILERKNQHKILNLTTDIECLPGVYSGKGEYITHQAVFKGNDFELHTATKCDCGRIFKCWQSLRINKARCSK